jgi:hypothetical protein
LFTCSMSLAFILGAQCLIYIGYILAYGIAAWWRVGE